MIGNIKIIAVCMCKVYDERNYRIIRALNNFAVENDYRLFVYHTCSDLYWKTLSEKGEQSVFDLIDYNITDAVVTFEEGVSSAASDVYKRQACHISWRRA